MNPEQIEDYLRLDPPKNYTSEYRGKKYLPIQNIERLLADIFGWDGYKIDAPPPQIVGNEIVFTVHLSVWSERRMEWITRAGTGSQPIQQKKGSTPDNWFTNKQINTLQKDAPAALSHAVSNAAERLGNIFGANLKRGVSPFDEGTAEDPKIEGYKTQIRKAENEKDLSAVWHSIPAEYRKNQSIVEFAKMKKNELG